MQRGALNGRLEVARCNFDDAFLASQLSFNPIAGAIAPVKANDEAS